MKKTIYAVFLLSIAFFLTGNLYAQVTTASISGKIIGNNNEPIIGANIKAEHQASGSIYGAMTNTNGLFTIQGMRPGGPYKITITYVGMKSKVLEGIYLNLGEDQKINSNLEEGTSLNEVVVVGQGVGANKTGAAMNISRNEITRMPSISHGIADVTRLNPQIRVTNGGAMYFAGTNNRYNSFQIDGAMNNDVFGLTSNGSNGGQAGTQPISMETVAQIQVNVAPYDVRQSGFTGGAINAITKSGTNEVHGSIYGFGNNQNLIGSKYLLANGNTSAKYSDQKEYQAGLTVGGPIIKNKLFFFANYEKANKTYLNPYAIGATASNVDATIANQLLAKVKEMANAQGVTYNGSLDATDVYTKSDKGGIKLDWNINSKNKASFRWSIVSANQTNSASGASSLNSSDYTYNFNSVTNSFVAELQSRLNNNLSNEFRASFVRVRDQREPGNPFPMISIAKVGTNGGTLNIGNERSSMANALDQNIWSFTDNLTWYKGKHTFTFGTHNEFYSFTNLYIQDIYGSYYFASPDDFYSGKIKQYRYGTANTSVTGDPRWAAKFGAGQIGFYAQDKVAFSDNFNLTYGLRMDIPLFFDTPAENSTFNAYAESKSWGYKTNTKLKSTPLFSPRVGFRWEIDKVNPKTLRGGVGIFTGRIPFVWLGNNFANTGIQLSTYNTTSTSALSVILNPNGQSANADKLTATGTQTINVFDKKFKFAQNLRTNLAFDFRLGGINWTAEGIYSKILNDILYRNLAVDVTGKTFADVSGLSFDTRPMLAKLTDATNYNGIYALSNTNKGYSYNLTLSGKKKFDFGLELFASYAFTQSKSLNSGTSSVAQSNWDYNYTYGNPNSPELGFSAFNTPHAINVSAFYTKKWAGKQTTTVGLIYTGNSGMPYSVYYYGDLNGDNSSGNDLMFIPTDDQVDQMKFIATSAYTVDQQKANMKAWLGREDYLKDHRGEYFKRYAANEKFEHHFDLHLSHAFEFNFANSIRGVELSLDMINVGNLFNKKWGRTSSAPGYYSPVTYNSSSKAFQFLQNDTYTMHSYSDYYSRWRGQIGLKLTF